MAQTQNGRQKLRKEPRKAPPQLRVKTTPELIEEYVALARRWGYKSTSPFVRRLLDAARQGNPKTGKINFFHGTDVVEGDHAA